MNTSADVANLFNITRETVRQWAEEFKEDGLSPSANPGPKRPRQFTDEDMRILSVIANCKARGLRYSDIHFALANGERRDPPEMPSSLKIVDRGKIATLERQVSDLTSALTDAVKEGQQQAGENRLLKEQIKELQDKVDRLNREIGRLEAGKGE